MPSRIAAAFTNPAMLREGGAGASFLWTKPFLSITQTAETGPGQEFVAQTPPISAGWTAAVNLGDFGALDVSVKGISHFAPHTVSAGASASLLEDRLFVTADVTWEHWSAVPPLVADMSIVLQGTLLDLGFNKDVVSRPLEMGFSDVVSPRVAAEWHQTGRLTFRAGYALRSTPAPAQTGRTNFLDSTAHLVVKAGPNRSPDYRFGGSMLNTAVMPVGWFVFIAYFRLSSLRMSFANGSMCVSHRSSTRM